MNVIKPNICAVYRLFHSEWFFFERIGTLVWTNLIKQYHSLIPVSHLTVWHIESQHFIFILEHVILFYNQKCRKASFNMTPKVSSACPIIICTDLICSRCVWAWKGGRANLIRGICTFKAITLSMRSKGSTLFPLKFSLSCTRTVCNMHTSRVEYNRTHGQTGTTSSTGLNSLTDAGYRTPSSAWAAAGSWHYFKFGGKKAGISKTSWPYEMFALDINRLWYQWWSYCGLWAKCGHRPNISILNFFFLYKCKKKYVFEEVY